MGSLRSEFQTKKIGRDAIGKGIPVKAYQKDSLLVARVLREGSMIEVTFESKLNQPRKMVRTEKRMEVSVCQMEGSSGSLK